jgi:hypothetical protein
MSELVILEMIVLSGQTHFSDSSEVLFTIHGTASDLSPVASTTNPFLFSATEGESEATVKGASGRAAVTDTRGLAEAAGGFGGCERLWMMVGTEDESNNGVVADLGSGLIEENCKKRELANPVPF